MRVLSGLAGLWLLRGWALCLGVFTLVNLVVARLDGGIDSNLWWLDLRHLPGSTELVAFGLAGLLLVTVALVPAAVVARPRLLVGVRVAPGRTVRRGHSLDEALDDAEPDHLLSNRRRAFRACRGAVRESRDGLRIGRQAADALQIRPGETLRYVPAKTPTEVGL